MSHVFFAQSAGTTGRPIWENPSSGMCYPHVRLFNAGATDVFLRGSSMSSGSSESSGFLIKSSQYSHEMMLAPGDALHCFTTNATCVVHVHVWGELHSLTEPLKAT
jgi:hypothetical protein